MRRAEIAATECPEREDREYAQPSLDCRSLAAPGECSDGPSRLSDIATSKEFR